MSATAVDGLLVAGTLFGMTCLHVLGIYFFESNVLPAIISVIIVGTAFVFVGMISILMVLVRQFVGHHVAQRGIRHLLIATATTAVMIR